MTRTARSIRFALPTAASISTTSTRRSGEPVPNFALTFWISCAAVSTSVFAAVTYDVVGRRGIALLDPRFERFVVAHRVEWLTHVMQAVTWLGSSVVIVPLLVGIGAYFLISRRDWRPGVMLTGAVAGTIVLYDVAKVAVDRPRPPATLWLGHFSGFGFPSGHAAQAVAFYGMVAAIVPAVRRAKVHAWLWGAAGLIALTVGASRVYLGAHWLGDVFGGWALGAAWLSVLLAGSVLWGMKRPP